MANLSKVRDAACQRQARPDLTGGFIVMLPNSIKILMISLLLLTGCATSTGSQSQSDCPPGSVKIQDEDTGKYDCASQREYEEIGDALDQRVIDDPQDF